jgi:hypothetical protein
MGATLELLGIVNDQGEMKEAKNQRSDMNAHNDVDPKV